MHGGKRQGAGRKPGYKAKVAELYNELLAKEVEKERLPLIRALVDKAKSGDMAAIREIHERIAGKVKDEMDLRSNVSHTFDDLPEATFNAIVLRMASRIKSNHL